MPSKRIGAKRLVIDSLVGFEMALAPGFRADFRESLYRMIGGVDRSGGHDSQHGRGGGYIHRDAVQPLHDFVSHR